jgi:hypothetical protein
MFDAKGLPRVLYTGGADLEPLHALLDARLPVFRAERLGDRWPTVIGDRLEFEGEEYSCHSPLDHSLKLGSYCVADAATVARAVAAARKGHETWGSLRWQDRLAHMRRLARELDDARHDIAMGILHEVGKTRSEALGEAEEAVALIEYYADQLERNQGYAAPAWRSPDDRETAQTILRPLGVFGVISPFNYPLALAVNMTSAAMMAGNAVVLKPTPNGALVACRVASSTSSTARKRASCSWMLRGWMALRSRARTRRAWTSSASSQPVRSCARCWPSSEARTTRTSTRRQTWPWRSRGWLAPRSACRASGARPARWRWSTSACTTSSWRAWSSEPAARASETPRAGT